MILTLTEIKVSIKRQKKHKTRNSACCYCASFYWVYGCYHVTMWLEGRWREPWYMCILNFRDKSIKVESQKHSTKHNKVKPKCEEQ